jgi:hypothetical protein
MAYSTCQRVAGMISNLLNGASSFDELGTAIRPASADLIRFMSSGCALIETTITSMGYTPRTGTAIDDMLADIEATYTAARAEAARASPRTAAGERTRADMYRREYRGMIDDLKMIDLSRLGFAYDGKWYVGGISKSEKQAVASNTDRVDPRFSRDQFRNRERGGTSACR